MKRKCDRNRTWKVVSTHKQFSEADAARAKLLEDGEHYKEHSLSGNNKPVKVKFRRDDKKFDVKVLVSDTKVEEKEEQKAE